MPMKIFKKGQKNRKGAFALALTGLTLALLLTLTGNAISYAAEKTKTPEKTKEVENTGSRGTSSESGVISVNSNPSPRPAAGGGGIPSSYTSYPTDNSSLLSHLKAILHPGAGEQYVNGKIILDSGVRVFKNISTYFDARSSGSTPRPSFFQSSKNVTHSVLASLYDFTVVDGPLFIGFPLGAFQSSVGNNGSFGFDTVNSNNPIVDLWTGSFGSRNPFSATLQKVNIAGAVRSSALAHQYSDPQRVCVNAKGIFTLNCPSTPQTYSCTGTLPANATLCSGDDQGLAQDTNITLVSSCTNTQKCEAICNGGYHEENGACVADATYHWETGRWSQCSQASQASCEGAWTTEGTGACVEPSGVSVEHCEEEPDGGGSSGISYDCEYCRDQRTSSECTGFDSRCVWNTSIENHSCSASNPQSASECTQQNSACHWVDAQDSVRRRSVNCVDQSGTVVADSNCSGTKPDITQLCGVCGDDINECEVGNVANIGERTETINCNTNGVEATYRTWDCVVNGGYTVSCEEEIACFLPNTKVTMADGSLKNIQDVQIGEKVVGRNGEISPVLGVHRPSVKESAGGNKVYAFNGGRFFVTAEHPFLTTEGWKAIDPVISKEKHPEISSIAHLKIGDTLITDHGKVVINSITSKEVDPDTTVYNLILGGDHTYIADGYIVHNNKCDTTGGPHGGSGGNGAI